MNLRRIIIDLELEVDDDDFKAAGLSADSSGVCDATEGAVRDAVTRMLVESDWRAIGVRPLRSIVTPRVVGPEGWYEPVRLAGDWGVGAPEENDPVR